MDVSLWADIRRLTEVECLSQCAISRRLHCSRRTIKKALAASTPPGTVAAPRTSIIDPYRTRIDALIQQHPDISAVRVHEEISRGPEGYRGCVRLVRSYVSRIHGLSCRDRFIGWSPARKQAGSKQTGTKFRQFG